MEGGGWGGVVGFLKKSGEYCILEAAIVTEEVGCKVASESRPRSMMFVDCDQHLHLFTTSYPDP